MFNNDIIDVAIYNTYIDIKEELGSEFATMHILRAIKEFIQKGEIKYFTNKNGEGENLHNNVTPEQLAKYLAEVFYENCLRQSDLDENDAWLKVRIIADKSRKRRNYN